MALDEETKESLKQDAQDTAEDKFSQLSGRKKVILAYNFLKLEEEDIDYTLSKFGVLSGTYAPDSEYGQAFKEELYKALEEKSREVLKEVVSNLPEYDTVDELLEDD